MKVLLVVSLLITLTQGCYSVGTDIKNIVNESNTIVSNSNTQTEDYISGEPYINEEIVYTEVEEYGYELDEEYIADVAVTQEITQPDFWNEIEHWQEYPGYLEIIDVNHLRVSVPSYDVAEEIVTTVAEDSENWWTNGDAYLDLELSPTNMEYLHYIYGNVCMVYDKYGVEVGSIWIMPSTDIHNEYMTSAGNINWTFEHGQHNEDYVFRLCTTDVDSVAYLCYNPDDNNTLGFMIYTQDTMKHANLGSILSMLSITEGEY